MKVLAYTSPARGHLNPMMGPLLELRRRGAEVHVRTLSPAVEAVRAAGLEAEPLAPAIEALTHDDHEAKNQMASGARSYATFEARAPHEVPDLEAALAAVGPDLALVDCTTYGAKAVAEREGIPWAESQPFLLQEAAPGVPPAGLGMRPMRSPLGTVRDRSLNLIGARFDQRFRLPPVNAGRRAAGLPRLGHLAESHHRGPLTLYFTAEPFDYPRPLPPTCGWSGRDFGTRPPRGRSSCPPATGRWCWSPAPPSSRTTARSPPRRSPGWATATASSSPPPGSIRPGSATTATPWSSASSPTPRSSPTPTWSSATAAWA
jgi:hypothetical protein